MTLQKTPWRVLDGAYELACRQENPQCISDIYYWLLHLLLWDFTLRDSAFVWPPPVQDFRISSTA